MHRCFSESMLFGGPYHRMVIKKSCIASDAGLLLNIIEGAWNSGLMITPHINIKSW